MGARRPRAEGKLARDFRRLIEEIRGLRAVMAGIRNELLRMRADDSWRPGAIIGDLLATRRRGLLPRLAQLLAAAEQAHTLRSRE